MNPIQRLNKDLANASATLSDAEARFLVDSYYQMQDARIRADGQVRSIEKATPKGEKSREPSSESAKTLITGDH